MENNKNILTIIGAGEGLPYQIALRFIKDNFTIVLISRTLSKLEGLKKDLIQEEPKADVHVFAADASNEKELGNAFDQIKEKIGKTTVLIVTAGVFVRKDFLEITSEEFRKTWETNTLSSFLSAKNVLPDMLQAGKGTIIFSGATASVKASPLFSAFASAKFATRALAQSLAKEYGPKGIHVAHVLIDGVIKMEKTKRWGIEDEKLINPKDLAETYYLLYSQSKSSWTHELDVRPFTEKW
eukprot:TRINITY_DN1454_c0_g1_i2.p1 TRINITY_DN1454_c0_g1~~TRINITY_DN1454_c0_g1_i2.p1  ORF type:complete len:240 (-),score=64.93 TRINITY_DN1454_c0_g1_i2:9-728(-)